MKLVYSGPKQTRIMQFPIPVIYKTGVEGEVKFTRGKATEVRDDWAEQCLKVAPAYFTKVEPKDGKEG